MKLKIPKMFKSVLLNKYTREFIRTLYYIWIGSYSKKSFHFKKIKILCTPYVEHVALALKHVIDPFVDVEVVNFFDIELSDELYVVLCPQFFGRLPRKRIVYNFEQPRSSQYFKKSDYYLFINSLGILDYCDGALLDHWHDLKMFNYHVVTPSTFSPQMESSSGFTNKPIFDFIFFGALNDRRLRIVSELKNHFKIKVVTNSIGLDLEKELLSARFCLNIHYFDSSPFEVVRFLQCLNVNLPMISEVSYDQNRYSTYNCVLRFVDFSTSNDYIRDLHCLLNEFSNISLDFDSLRNSSFEIFSNKVKSSLSIIGVDLLNRSYSA